MPLPKEKQESKTVGQDTTAGLYNGGVPDQIKAVLGGNGGVGKTTFIKKALTGQFNEAAKLTVGAADVVDSVNFRGVKDVKVTLGDLGGNERFRWILDSYAKGATCGILMYDVTDIASARNVQDWAVLFAKTAVIPVPVIIGTKIDLLSGPAENADSVQFINAYVSEIAGKQNGLEPLHKLVSSKTGIKDELHSILQGAYAASLDYRIAHPEQ